MEREPDGSSDLEDEGQVPVVADRENTPEKATDDWMTAYSPPPAPEYNLGTRKGGHSKKRSAAPAHADPLEMEVDRWFVERWSQSTKEQEKWDALKWWEAHQQRYPRIAPLARRVLATQVRGWSVPRCSCTPYIAGTLPSLPAWLPLPGGCMCRIAVPPGWPAAQRCGTWARQVVEAGQAWQAKGPDVPCL